MLDELLNQYIDYCRYERAFSPLTCQHYEADCRRFFAYLKNRNIKQNDLTPTVIQQWLMTIHAEGKSPRTLARALAALRGFFTYCVNHALLSDNPTTGIKVPKANKKLPDTLDVDQIQSLLDAPTEDDLTFRDHVMLELFYSSGLRLSEFGPIQHCRSGFSIRFITRHGQRQQNAHCACGQ